VERTHDSGIILVGDASVLVDVVEDDGDVGFEDFDDLSDDDH
jgi:hypothetical protein